MDKPLRSYYLPAKLLARYERTCDTYGHKREMALAAAMLAFLDSDPNARAKAFERLERFLSRRK